jgi:hypothetical protein
VATVQLFQELPIYISKDLHNETYKFKMKLLKIYDTIYEKYMEIKERRNSSLRRW